MPLIQNWTLLSCGLWMRPLSPPRHAPWPPVLEGPHGREYGSRRKLGLAPSRHGSQAVLEETFLWLSLPPCPAPTLAFVNKSCGLCERALLFVI